MMRVIGWLAGLVLALSLPSPAKSEPRDADTVDVIFVGDIVLDGKPGQAIAADSDPFAPFAPLLDNADLRIGNLECVIATSGTPVDKNYNFRAHPRTLPVLQRHFDAVGIANNHSGDYGQTAFSEMLNLLEAAGVPYFGGGRDLHAAHAPLIMERKGLRLALLAYDEFLPRSFEAGSGYAGVAWSEDEQVAADIRRAKSAYRADLVITFMHWGWENETTASLRQRHLARVMIDAGADAVIGGHPHVVQDVDVYRGKPILYSLGNFMFDAVDNEAQTHGWAVKLSMTRDGVQRWQTFGAKLDADGIPHPEPAAAEPCWRAGDGHAGPCRP